MTFRYKSFAETLNIGLSLLGAWALYAQICVIIGFDFTTLKAMSLLPLLLWALLWLVIRGSSSVFLGNPDVPQEPRRTISLPLWCRVSAPFVVAHRSWLFPLRSASRGWWKDQHRST